MARSHVKELAREAFKLTEVVVDTDGTTVWITRGRWVFRRRPPGC